MTKAGLEVRMAVYPRVRGGTRRTRLRSPGLKGLSPRARGNRASVNIQPGVHGSIPACAGEPRSPRA